VGEGGKLLAPSVSKLNWVGAVLFALLISPQPSLLAPNPDARSCESAPKNNEQLHPNPSEQLPLALLPRMFVSLSLVRGFLEGQ
jgi:hypothetical protein